MQITSWIEYDVQRKAELWTISAERFKSPDGSYNAVPCEGEAVVAHGLELLGFDSATLHTRTVALEPGTSLTLTNSVILGGRDRYLIDLECGGRLVLVLTSREGNAALDIIAPSGPLLVRESAGEGLVLLEHAGEHQLIVGGIRRNATHELVATLQ